MRLLLAEDDPELNESVARVFRNRGDLVETCLDGEAAEQLGSQGPWDLVILDLGLPERDGLTVLRRWRERGVDAPILILSARDSWNDIVAGLRSGADDYLRKPFHTQELLARADALVRRTGGRAVPVIEVGELRFDMSRRIVTYRGEEVRVSAFEYRALEHFALNPGRVIPQNELIQHLYAQETELNSNAVEVLIARLRRKTSSDLIRTVRGHGYVLSPGD